MKKRIQILSTNIIENVLLLQTDQSINGLIPGGQILVDSDMFSFIYLMEDQDEYTYLILQEQIWPLIKTAMDRKLPVLIADENVRMELINFHDELEFLVSNIKGNSNYGRKMVEKVERIF